MNEYQVAIIGGGPAGYETAIRLKQYGIDVVVFEKDKLGGVCLNHGCIPTKSMVKVADLFDEMKKAEDFGINAVSKSVNFENIQLRKNKIVERLISGIDFIFKKREIPVINEKVEIIIKNKDKYEVKTENSSIVCDYLIVATGSRSKTLPSLPVNYKNIITSREMLKLSYLPEDLVVVGGGVIGCEFATIFSQLGTKVTIVEYLPTLLPAEDEEVSKRFTMILKKQKVKIMTKVGVVNSHLLDDGTVRLSLSNGKEINTKLVLVSVGRNPVFDIKTENFELEINNGAIKIDDQFMTNEENFFSIGDVTAKLMLAHTASKQGLMLAKIIKDKIDMKVLEVKQPLNYKNIPRCTFTNPEIASVGLTEKEAKEQFEEIIIGKFPFSANGKSLSAGNQLGFVKVIANKITNKILGVHIIGHSATELIAQGSMLINLDVNFQDVEKVVFAHPTLSEALMEAVEDLEQLSIHTVR